MDARATQLRELHDEHAGVLWRYLMKTTGDAALSEDIVQETLLRAWRTPAVLERPSGARAWLFTVARNLLVDEWRSARSRHELPTEQLPERAAEDELDAALDGWLIADALSALSLDHRRVIVLAHYRGRSIAQIADELDIAQGTVKSRLHYGLRALRLALQERGVSAP